MLERLAKDNTLEFYRTFFSSSLIKRQNKQQCLSLLAFTAWTTFLRPGASPKVERLKGAPLGQALSLLVNIRLDLKGLPGTNSLAYFSFSLVLKEKVLKHWSMSMLYFLLFELPK
jgi:hypothetical protein